MTEISFAPADGIFCYHVAMNDTQIVILAAGKGSRMNHPELPKPLVPLRGKPLLGYLLDKLTEFKDKIVIVVGYKKEKVTDFAGPEYSYAEQLDQKGTAHAVLAALDKLTAKNVVVLLGDMPFIKKESIERLIEKHVRENSKVTMFTVSIPNFEGTWSAYQGFGRVIRDSQGELIGVKEASDVDDLEREITELNPSTYVFDLEFLRENISKINNDNAKGEYYLTGIVELCTKAGIEIHSVELPPEEAFGANTPEELQIAETLIGE